MSQRGFTLIEVLLSVAILTLLTGISLPVYESFARRNDLDVKTQTVVSAIRRAENYARHMRQDSAWGVEVLSTGVTVFKGSTYASRDQSFDEITPISGTTTVSGVSEIIFAKMTAAPNTTGTITLSSTANDTRAIVVNAKGMVSY